LARRLFEHDIAPTAKRVTIPVSRPLFETLYLRYDERFV
jgi:hypothetical protein